MATKIKECMVDGQVTCLNECLIEDLVEDLKEITEMMGPYSRDPLKHAENVIENLVGIAKRGIARVEGEDDPDQ